MPTNQVPITSPIKGVVRAVPREGQPPDTCWDAQNVLPYDRYGRKRLAQRPGIAKQYAQEMGNGNQFVQGMIEAPNIIYPPNALTVPVFSIDGLLPSPITTPGTTGPYAYNGPTGLSFNLQYQWSFNVSYTLSCTTSDDPFALSTMDSYCLIYWPLTDDPTQDLILYLAAGGDLRDDGVADGGVEISAVLYVGDPSLSSMGSIPGSWTRITPSNMFHTVDTSTARTGTASVAMVLTITSAGALSLSMTNVDMGSVSPQTGTYPAGILNFPELNVEYVTIGPYNGGTNTSSATQILSITD